MMSGYVQKRVSRHVLKDPNTITGDKKPEQDKMPQIHQKSPGTTTKIKARAMYPQWVKSGAQE